MASHILGNKTITDRILCSWIRCRRKAWLDQNENNRKKVWSAHRALQLDHQHKSLEGFLKNSPQKGIEGLKRGEREVVGVRLKGLTALGLNIEGHPLLLQRINGKSFWGEFSYIPITVRQGHRITRENRLSLAFWGYLIEQFQKIEVKYGLAISKVNNDLEVEKIIFTKKIKTELLDSLERINKDICKEDPPAITSDRKKCTLCSWKELCDEKANQEGDLSEVNGIGAKRKNILQEVGISNLNELASTSPIDLSKKLSKYGETHEKVASQLINQARVQINLVPKQLGEKIILPELKFAKGVLIYDIESDPDAKHDFLHGFVLLRRRENGEWSLDDAKYKPILNIENNNEKAVWNKLKDRLKAFQDLPVLHYGQTELLSFYKLAKRHGENEKEIKMMTVNFIDIHARLKRGWLLPLSNYSLKNVAQWLDFRWTYKGSNGARALLWWRQWKRSVEIKSQRSNKLEWILKYNRDDCIATWKIAEWLLNEK